MKKTLLYILILLLSATGARAIPTGYILADNTVGYAPGTRTVGTYSYEILPFPTVVLHPALPIANAGCGVDTLPWPIPNPATPTTAGTNRIGGGGGSGIITYYFQKPVYGVYVLFSGLNRAETLKVSVNKSIFVAPHFLIPSECTFFDCYASGLAGLCFLNSLGEMEGPPCCALGATSPYNGGTINIFDCKGITTFDIFCNGSDGGVNAALYFDTVKPAGCSDAIANEPCEPDSLLLGDVGDSTMATYFWVGPGSFTSTLQYPYRYPTTPAMSGTYKAFKTQTVSVPGGGTAVVHDTDTINVIIHPRAYIKVSNNGPICENPLDTLHLVAVTPGTPGEVFTWTGPNLFSSTAQSPDIYGFVAADSGAYNVFVTNTWGCSDSATTYVKLRPNPSPPHIIGPSPYCYGDPFVAFTTSGVTSGGSVLWYNTFTGGTGSPVPPVINTTVPGTTVVYASQVEAIYCESTRDSIVILVKPKITPLFSWNTILGCDKDVVTFTNTSTGAQWYSWDYGDGHFSADTTTKLTSQNEYTGHQVHTVTLHAYTPGCEVKGVGYVNTTHRVTAAFKPFLDTFCVNGSSTMGEDYMEAIDSSVVVTPDGVIGNLFGNNTTVDTGNFITNPSATPPTYLAANYRWDWGDGSFDNSNTRTPPKHRYDSGGVYKVKLTVTDSIGCVDSVSHEVYVIRLFLRSFHDTMICISQPLLLNVKPEPIPLLADQPYSYAWSPGDYLSDSAILQPYFNSGNAPDVIRTYTLTQTQTTYGCVTTDTIRIHAVKGVKLANVTPDATIMYGQNIQLNSDSEVYYFWKNNDGTLNNPNINNPVARPLGTTTYNVYGYDRNGCIDSAYVIVTVDSSMLENVPTGFTPNGDGLNDVFRPVGVQYQNLVDFRVYNRLGQQVFYSNSYKNGWDGTYNGVPQDLGVYTFVIIVARPGGEGENVVHKGTVTLIR
ncbi:MAG: hypothetical protein JWQ38_2803 [Flavipsychrobacter sp.]|nr:hypothetical protein [Flavipsychrobacter sp.]